jgi:hypothetical protein
MILLDGPLVTAQSFLGLLEYALMQGSGRV